MGCNNSKTTKKEEQQVETGAGKTLLTTEPATDGVKEAEPAAAADAAVQAEPKAEAAPPAEPVPLPVKVTIKSAKGLRNADWVGKSDPYCTCEVTGKTETKVETPSVTDQLNPEWNHEAELSGYCIGDSLTFLIKDKDPAKPDDSLGKVVLESAKFFPVGFEGQVPVCDAGEGIEAFLTVKLAVVHPKVRVTVVGAKGLRNADWVGKSDPYCICEIPGKDDAKFATPSVDNNLNPQWNHEGEVVGYQVPEALSFTVKDKDPLKPDDILGCVSLPYSSFTNGFQGELQLTQTGEGITSSVLVKVEIGDKVEQAAEPVAEAAEEDQKDVGEAASPPAQDAASPQVVADEMTITTDTAPPQASTCWC